MNPQVIIDSSYVAAAFLFIYGLKRMSSPVTARSGIVVAGFGMLVATLASFLYFFGVDEAARPHLERAYQLDPPLGEQAAHQLEKLARFQLEHATAEQAIATARFGLDFAELTEQLDRAQDLRILIKQVERRR